MKFILTLLMLVLSCSAYANNSPVIWGSTCSVDLRTGQCLSTGGGTTYTFNAPLVNSGGSVSCTNASGSQPGCLLSSDWNTFNGKQNALSFGNLTDAGTDGIVVGSGVGAVIGSGTSLSQHVSDTTHNGYLSSIDWNTFSSKLASTDGAYSLANTSDATKLQKFDLSGQTTGTTLTVAPQNTSNMTLHVPQVATASGAGMALVQDETTGFIFSSGIISSLGGANSMMQLANASTANRAQIKLHSYFNGTSVAGVSTLTSRSGAIGTNAAVVAGQDYSKWTAQAGATTPGSAPISGAWAFKANTVNSLSVTSDFHLQLTNLAGTLGDRLYLGSEGALQLPFYGTGLLHSDSTGNMTSSAVNLASADVSGLLPLANISSPGVSGLLYVDAGRTDTYTADGTVLRPFKTIGAATSQIITNNNGNNYTIWVAPGTYTETIILNNAAFTRLAIIASSNTNGSMANDAIPITSIVGDITSTSNNDQFKAFVMRGFDVQGNINFTGASTGSNLCTYGCIFSAMTIYSNSAPAVTFNNLGQMIFDDNGTAIASGAGGITITNVNSFLVYHTFLSLGTMALTTNNGANKPSGFAGTSAQTSFGNFIGAITVDAGSSLTQRYERVNGTVSNSGTMTGIQSTYQAVVTQNSGASWTSNGDLFTAQPVYTAITPTFNGFRFDKQHLLNGAAAATNVVIAFKDGHLNSTQTTVPTATVNANAGTGATCTVSNATDLAGTISLTTTAVAPAAGAQCAVNFNKTYNVAPICVVTPTSSNAALFSVANGEYFTTTTGTLVVNYANADATGHANTWAYNCVETQ